MGLTAVAIKATKDRAKPYKLTNSDGSYLLVMPSGGRYWRMNYRYLTKLQDAGLRGVARSRAGRRKSQARRGAATARQRH